jgi:hypothetical protein
MKGEFEEDFVWEGRLCQLTGSALLIYYPVVMSSPLPSSASGVRARSESRPESRSDSKADSRSDSRSSEIDSSKVEYLQQQQQQQQEQKVQHEVKLSPNLRVNTYSDQNVLEISGHFSKLVFFLGFESEEQMLKWQSAFESRLERVAISAAHLQEKRVRILSMPTVAPVRLKPTLPEVPEVPEAREIDDNIYGSLKESRELAYKQSNSMSSMPTFAPSAYAAVQEK